MRHSRQRLADVDPTRCSCFAFDFLELFEEGIHLRNRASDMFLVIVYSRAGNFLEAELLSKFLQLQDVK